MSISISLKIGDRTWGRMVTQEVLHQAAPEIKALKSILNIGDVETHDDAMLRVAGQMAINAINDEDI